MKLKKKLISIYNRLYKTFGPRNWWPGDTPFEIIVGAILTQNTAWKNVERAIDNLKEYNLLYPDRLQKLNSKRLKDLIKPAGFYNIKAKRLKNFLIFLKKYNNSIKKLKNKNFMDLRERLLEINGIGKETADSILLYALNKPIFVIDAYTKRILERHKLLESDADYDAIQRIFMKNLPHDYKLFNEYHALIVEAGKRFCKSKKPLCRVCPLKAI